MEKLVHDYIRQYLRVDFVTEQTPSDIYFNEKTYIVIRLKDEILQKEEIKALREDF